MGLVTLTFDLETTIQVASRRDIIRVQDVAISFYAIVQYPPS